MWAYLTEDVYEVREFRDEMKLINAYKKMY